MDDGLISKWDFMLTGIEKKSLKSRYAKIYEKSALNNSFSYFKLVVTLLFKIFSNKDVSGSNSKKNRIELGREYREALFDQNVIFIDAFEYFVQRCINNLNDIDKINFLKINEEDDQLVVYIVY